MHLQPLPSAAPFHNCLKKYIVNFLHLPKERSGAFHAVKTHLLLVAVLFFSLTQQALSQEGKSISGYVTSTENEKIIGANILVKGTILGTQTDTSGNFSLLVNEFPVKLVISYVGYKTAEVLVSKPEARIQLTLAPETSSLSEVVVIGYGTTARTTLTSSITKIQGQDLAKQPIQNPVVGLQGRVAGLFMSVPSGNLGANPTVTIRGNNSILSSSNPLYIIDGVPMPSTGINSAFIGGATGVQSPFINLNAADIESVEVLKDADATAIYGTRGANGVILITTRKGAKGAAKVNLDIYTGYQQAVDKVEYLSTAEYLQLRKDAFAADEVTPTAANAPDLLVWDQKANTDWQKLLFGEKARVTDVQSNIQGGNDNTNYLFSLGYRDENGVILGINNQKKYSARINLNHRAFGGKLTINNGINYSTINTAVSALSGVGAFTNALPPNLPLKNATTGLPYYYNTQTWGSSPLRYEHTRTDTKNYQFVGSTSIAYNILPNLNAKVDAAFTRLDYTGNEKYRNAYLNPFSTYDYKNYTYFGTNFQNTYNIEPQLNYRVRVGKSKVAALAGATWQHTLLGGQIVTGYDFPSETLMKNLGSAARVGSYSTTNSEYKFNSVFARVNYDFTDKYVLNATFRRDGSSRFAPENRFGNFWAIGGAWILSKESFIKDHVGVISFAKLRSSYGLTGNDAISNYQYLETFAATSFPYNNTAGIYANRLGNSKIKWETNKKFEVALELNLLENRISTTTAFFNNQSSNQLVNYPIATQTGWTSYVANLDGALIRNRGIEFELTSKNIQTTNFNWTTTFNFTSYKNYLVSFPGLSSSTYSNTYEIGKPITAYRLYEFSHIDPNTGIPYVIDKNGDGSFTANGDYSSFGNSAPSFYGGFGNTFSYKGFSLEAFFQFVKRPETLGFLWFYYYPIGNPYNVPRFIADEVWRSPSDPGTLPRLSQATSGTFYRQYQNFYGYSNAMLDDASFIRLKNLTFSYTIPQRLSKQMKISNLRVYVLGQNLLTYTKFKGLDPESGSTGLPLLKTYTLGLNLAF
jgi:TonB-dependent starch-binding outer membrane protein SusC